MEMMPRAYIFVDFYERQMALKVFYDELTKKEGISENDRNTAALLIPAYTEAFPDCAAHVNELMSKSKKRAD